MKKYKSLIVIAILAVLAVGYYIYLSKKPVNTDPVDSQKEKSLVAEYIARDLNATYPETPSGVVKLYSEIMKCYYSEKYTDEQLEQLVSQARLLWDNELLEKNPMDEYMINLKADIKSYKDKSRVIKDFKIDGSAAVDYQTDKDGAQYASLHAEYWVRENNTTTTKSYEKYMLRKDENGNWKILYWQLSEATDIKDE